MGKPVRPVGKEPAPDQPKFLLVLPPETTLIYLASPIAGFSTRITFCPKYILFAGEVSSLPVSPLWEGIYGFYGFHDQGHIRLITKSAEYILLPFEHHIPPS
jgi:hypothetical protein